MKVGVCFAKQTKRVKFLKWTGYTYRNSGRCIALSFYIYRKSAMLQTNSLSHLDDIARADGIEVKRQEALLKTGALQNAILTSENFSIIATDEKGIIQLFNVGAERMLG